MLHIHPWQTHIRYVCEVTAQAAYGAPWFHYFPAGRGGVGVGGHSIPLLTHTQLLSVSFSESRAQEKRHTGSCNQGLTWKKKKKKRGKPSKAA